MHLDIDTNHIIFVLRNKPFYRKSLLYYLPETVQVTAKIYVLFHSFDKLFTDLFHYFSCPKMYCSEAFAERYKKYIVKIPIICAISVFGFKSAHSNIRILLSPHSAPVLLSVKIFFCYKPNLVNKDLSNSNL